MMGTGSFGGGSGSLGGGGSGASGKGGGGSLLRAVEALRAITRQLTADSTQPVLTRGIIELLRDRGRAGTLKILLASPFANALLGDLLAVKQRLDRGETWSQVAQSFGIAEGAGSLVRFCDARVDHALGNLNYEVDERHINRAGDAFRTFFQSTVGGDLNLASHGNHAEVDAGMDKAKFANSVGGFLGALIAHSVGAESLRKLGATWTSVKSASVSIANAGYDKFDARFIAKGKARPVQALTTISEHYFSLLVGGGDAE